MSKSCFLFFFTNSIAVFFCVVLMNAAWEFLIQDNSMLNVFNEFSLALARQQEIIPLIDF